ncbi:BTB/POZ domain-containing protein 6-like [Centruroides sculpturatus]|uniref:BTB/POZ domain-containing protein 6-like n=1 Tax=Centruroides sculpturatus TaxID=218467 RepID=UPI000C6CD339|nr:BTB/POZ domain-containing protein 6-like [Centruroides sculpturatus]
MEETFEDFVIVDRAARLFNNNHLSDVTVITGEGANQKSFPAHSLILKISSPMFEEKLQGEKELKFPSVNPSVMEAVLKYIYADSLPDISSDVAIETYSTADYFMLPHLKTLCCDHLLKILSPSNAVEIFEFAYESGVPSILSKSAVTLFKETDKVLKSNGLSKSNVSQNTVMKIILNASPVDEKTLLRQIIEWAINKNDKLEDLLKPLIPHFCLSAKERMDILLSYSLTSEKCSNLSKLNSTNQLESQSKHGENLIPLNLHSRNYNKLEPLKKDDTFTIVFYTELDCFIEAIALPIISKVKTFYTVQFEINFADLNSKQNFEVPSTPRIFLQCETDDLTKFRLHYPLFVKKRNPVKLKIVNLEKQLNGLDIIRHQKVNGQFEWNEESIAYIPNYHSEDDSNHFQISGLLLRLIE